MLFGIKKIQVCQANQLQGDYVSVPNQIITELTNALDDVPFIKNQSLFSIEESIENNETIFKSTLTFVSECQPQLPKICAFVITLNNNMRFLIGTPTRPFVEVTTRLNIAAAASDTTAYTTTCTYQSNYRPLLLPTIENQISDDRQFEIIGSAIKQNNNISDDRQFEIVGSAIKQNNNISDDRQFEIVGSAIKQNNNISDDRQFEICCGEITNTTIIEQPLTIVWLDYFNNEIARAVYLDDEDEPTTTLRPTLIRNTIRFSFAKWELYKQINKTKYYKATYYDTGAGPKGLKDGNVHSYSYQYTYTIDGTTYTRNNINDTGGEFPLLYIYTDLTYKTYIRNIIWKLTSEDITLDWTHFDNVVQVLNINLENLGLSFIYNSSNERIGFTID